MQFEKFFGKFHLNNHDSELLDFGNIFIRLNREGQGWIIKSFNKDQAEPETGEFYQTGNSSSLVLAPALQTKPLVFKGSDISILPSQKLTFFVKIPMVIQVYNNAKQDENLIAEIVHTRLSDTWFGEPDNGEPAYLLGSDFYLNIREMEIKNYETICPIQVFNHSDKLLELQRLIIRVENMTLYKVNNNVVTSLVKIEYKGKDSISSAGYGVSKAYHGDKPHVICKPRSENESQLKINFHFIRNIYKNS